MLLKFKTLQQQTFTLECNESQTVSEIKTLIFNEKGFLQDCQKLIFSGKILNDADTVASAKITEKDFIVVMVTKPKPAAPAPAQTTPAPTPAASIPPINNNITPQQVSNTSEPVSSFDASTLGIFMLISATGAAYQSAVKNLIEMGFPAEGVSRAMKAAYNNPDRAAEYLMTGIPDNIESLSRPDTVSSSVPAAQPAPTTSQPVATPNPQGHVNLFDAGAALNRPATANSTTAGTNDLASIAQNPEFQQLRRLIQTQPQLLQPALAQLGQAQPEVLAAINQNPEAFIRLLSEGAPEGLLDFEGDNSSVPPPGGQVITLSDEEHAAVERLVSLGFEPQMAAEAYLACDKNEELAANYLFENGDNWQ